MANRFTQQLKSLASVAKQLRLKGTLTALQSGAEFSQLIKPLGVRPFVLSPHPGDEVMAMGGAMASYAKARTPVSVLTLTAGCRGTNTGRLSRQLGPKRKKEQIKGFEAIGGTISPSWWGLDEKFIVTDDTVESLLDVVSDLNPDIIYVPSFLDDHPDSLAAADLLARTLPRLPKMKLRELWVAQYELWTPIVPNKILNCDAVVEKKQQAIEAHESQLLCRDYLSAMLGLGRYRAAMLGAGSSAEAFYITRADQYLAMSESVRVPVLKQV